LRYTAAERSPLDPGGDLGPVRERNQQRVDLGEASEAPAHRGSLAILAVRVLTRRR
jgi:hypothetical protein